MFVHSIRVADPVSSPPDPARQTSKGHGDDVENATTCGGDMFITLSKYR